MDYTKTYNMLMKSFFGKNLDCAERDNLKRRGFTVRRLRTRYHDLISNVSQPQNGIFETIGHKSECSCEETAWKMLSGYVSVDKEGRDLSLDVAVARERYASHYNGNQRANVDLDAAIYRCSRIEEKVLECIRNIGEMVLYSGKFELDQNYLFEYFCDKNILSLLVSIATFSPNNNISAGSNRYFSGVAYSPIVKAQILQTLSTLLSSNLEFTSLYFLLSNNHINGLISSFLPLSQFTSSALEELVPAYASFLKSLCILLTSAPDLFELLYQENLKATVSSDPVSRSKISLFTAVVSIATSGYAKTDSCCHLTALNILMNLMQNKSEHIRASIEYAEHDQQLLFDHLCRRLLVRYNKIKIILMGPSFDPDRCAILQRHLADIRDQLLFISDVLNCSIKPLNVRLCEFLLRRVVCTFLLPGLLESGVVKSREESANIREQAEKIIMLDDPGSDYTNDKADRKKYVRSKRKKLAAVDSSSIISLDEAKAQASLFVLSQCFVTMKYKPFLRMLCVALFHPYSPSNDWKILVEESALEEGDACRNHSSQQYTVTFALHYIAADDSRLDAKQSAHSESIAKLIVIDNPHRKALLSLLRGDIGDRRFCVTSVLVQSVLDCDQLDSSFLSSIKMLPFEVGKSMSSVHDKLLSPISFHFEEALRVFFTREHRSFCSISVPAIELAGALSLSFVRRSSCIFWDDSQQFIAWFKMSPLIRGLANSRSYSSASALSLKQSQEISALYVDLIQMEIYQRYSCSDCQYYRSLGKIDYASAVKNCAELLISSRKDFVGNKVEDARYVVFMTLHFRGICNLILEARAKIEAKIPREKVDLLSLLSTEYASDDIISIGALDTYPKIGEDLNLVGRTCFMCFSPVGDVEISTGSHELQSYLLLVVDPTMLYVVKTYDSDDSRGKIVLVSPIRYILATVADDIFLHVAMRPLERDKCYYSNEFQIGNMLEFGFESSGSCLIARDHLEKCRVSLKEMILVNIESLFRDCAESILIDEDDDDDSSI